MAQTGYTPVVLYASGTATNTPTSGNLASGELAINYADGKLFYKDSSNVVQVLASKAAASGAFTTLSASSTVSGSGFSTYLASPPAIGVTTPASGKFTSVTNTGLTSGRVTYATTNGLLTDSANLTFDGTNLTSGSFIPSSGTAPTNGMYLATTNSVGFSTNSTERMRIDTNGNVGIGTSSPISSLGFGESTTGITFQSTNTSLNLGKVAVIKPIVAGSGNGDLTFETYQGGSGGGERMRINSSGNVGIGTSSPASKLNVSGSNVTVSAGYGIAYSGDQTRIMTPEDNVSGALIRWGSGAICRFLNGSTENMRIDSSGNVGIGTDSPSSYGKLAVISASGTQLFVGADSSSNSVFRGFGIGITGTTAPYGSLQMQMNSGELKLESGNSGYGGFQTFYTAGAERMRIDTSGQLGVGTTPTATPANGFTVMAPTAGSYINVGHSNGTGSGTGYVQFVYNSGLIGSITQNGTTGVLYNTTSDYRLKIVIGNISDAGQRIDALEPIEYDWKTGGRTRGFLAHKFAEVYPNSVNGEKDAVDAEGKPVYQSMQASSSEVMADLIAEIQSLRKRIATLENK
jgi:hypothetical protein